MGLGVVGEVLQPGGVESVGSEEVTMTLHEHFHAPFAAEGGHWHTDKEVDRAMRALFLDSYAGALAREQILQPGVWPRQLGPMCSVAAHKGRARLMEMCQLLSDSEFFCALYRPCRRSSF